MTSVRVLLGVVLLLAFQARSEAELIFSMQEVGVDVFVNASGSVNTAGLSLAANGEGVGGIRPEEGAILMGGPSTVTGANYLEISGPAAWGSGGISLASSGSGGFGLTGARNFLFLPAEYVSGSDLTGSMTFAGQTFSGLGVTPGTYTYTWGNGANADSAILQIGAAPTPIPEPSTLALLAASSAGLALRRWRRR